MTTYDYAVCACVLIGVCAAASALCIGLGQAVWSRLLKRRR